MCILKARHVLENGSSPRERERDENIIESTLAPLPRRSTFRITKMNKRKKETVYSIQIEYKTKE